MTRLGSLFAAGVFALLLVPAVALAESDCTDGIDNDGDTLIDCLDDSCAAQACDDGVSCTIGETCDFGTTSCTGGTPTDSICDNGAFCDGAETCDAVLDCQAGTPPTLSDGVGCTDDSCDEVNDVVVNTPNDAACDNGAFCDGAETCDAVLDCQAGIPPVIDDGVTCTDDSCDEVNDVVVNAPNNAACDNGQFCDGTETCDAVLDCQAGTPPTLSDGVGCTDDSCDEVNDVVVNTANDSNCDNAQFCDGSETCDAINDCQAGTAPVIDDGVACTDDSCDEVNDVVVNATNNANCDNGAFCDGAETCDAVLDCQTGAPPVIDDGVGCTDDSCDEVNDVVVNAPNNASCDNGQFCDGAETCDAALDCQAGAPPVTDDGVGCTDDSCDEVNDIVVNAPNNASCDNGQFCDGTETCNAVLDCQAGAPPVTDDGVSCTDDSCDEVNDIVVNTANNANCDNGQFCDGTETCDAVLDCQAGAPPVTDDGVGCTDDSCDEVNDIVVNATNNANCDNGLFCDGAETCDAVNDCQAGTAVDPDDGVGCTDDSCDEANDIVVNAPNNGLCDNGDFCDGAETCDAVNDCQAGTAPTIDDGVSCTIDSCDEVNDVVVNTPNNGLCDNGQFCDGTETCDAVNDCQAGTPPNVSDGVPCTDDSCDEVNDVAVNTPNNANCDNGAFCDGAETCDAVSNCQAGTPPVVNDGVGCTQDICDEAGDQVINLPLDSNCDNGDFCDGSETCDAINDCQAGTPPVIDDGVSCTVDSCDEVNDVVINAPNNAICDNGLFCDGTETCDAINDCQAGATPAADDGVGCTDDFCDEVNDIVVNTPNDSNCDNGQFCDGAETCDAINDCQAGTAPVIDDGVGCTDDICDEVNDLVTNVANNSNCDNSLFCDGAETCDAVNDCQAGTAPTIDDGVSCTSDSCDEINDVVVNAPNNGLCDNGLFCDGAEICDAVNDCQAGTAPAIDDGVSCTSDSCDEINDVVVNAPNNGLCDNGLFCDGLETCDVVNDCQAGTAPTIDDGVSCTDDSCDEANDLVVNTANNANCDNGDFCDGAETCDAVNDCQAGTSVNVDDGVGCTDDSCDEVNDVIVNAVNDGNCDNTLFCDGSETCDAVNDCQAGTPPVIDDGVACTTDSCDEINDVVVNLPANGACDNGLFCDGIETCDDNGCLPGTPPVIDDGIACTADSCDELNDVVVHTPVNSSCSNGLFCDGEEICDVVNGCEAGPAPQVDDGVGCTVDFCDETNDIVTHTPNNAVCDNGQFCDGTESCNVVSDCQPGVPPTVTDGVGCTTDLCDETNDVVVHLPVDANCDNNLFCDGTETCDVINDCQAGTPPVIDDGVGCTSDSCDEVNDVVVNTPVSAACGNGLFCDGSAVCHPILDCQNGTPPVIDDGVACTVDFCDEVNDVVVHTPTDSLCDNSFFCDGAETCDAVLDCQAGTPPVVDDGVGCTTDSCDEVNDVVIHAPDDLSCDNGQFCDGAEVCDLVNDCSPGTAPVVDDGVGCTNDFCDETNDQVVNLADDALCDNTLFCDGTETCNPVTDCQPGPPPAIDDGVACTTDSCDEVNDIVINQPVAAACDNGLFCDGAEICDTAFGCLPGPPPQVNDAVGCTADSCDEVNDVIIHVPDNAFCGNGIFCDGIETCDVVNDCQPGVPPVVNDGIGCTDDSCDETNDTVINVVNDANCDNGLFCDGTETCDAVLDCQIGTAPVIDDGVSCTDDSCDEQADLVVNLPVDANCDNGQFCDGAETCDPALDCQAGTPPQEDGVGCTVDSCDEATDTVINAPNDASCDNGVPCSIDTCDPVLDCQHVPDQTQCADSGNLCGGGLVCNVDFGCEAGPAVNCQDDIACTVDLCDPATGACSFVPNHEVCNDGLFCNGVEICDLFNDCEVGIPFDCDDGVLCTFDSCDPAIDACRSVPADSACDNGVFCDGEEICDAELDCQPAEVPACSDNVDCTDDLCDEPSRICTYVANDANCSNGFFCDGDEVCNDIVGCLPGVAIDCTGSTFGCQTGFCNDLTDACDVQPDDLGCQNGVICDGAETCNAGGACEAGLPVDCTSLTDTCSIGFCDEFTGGCEIIVQNDGVACDDGDTCSTGDTCSGGVCVGTGSMCGDGIIDATCGEECEFPSSESCNTMEDLDSDGLFACEDPDCCSPLAAGCGADCRNVSPCLRLQDAKGTMRISSGPLDRLKLRGSIELADPSIVNPIEDGFTIALTDGDGLIYMGELFPGDLAERPRGPRRYVFKDKLAKVGQGTRAGIERLRIQVRDTVSPPEYFFKIKLSGELSGANTPSTSVHILGVEDAAVMRAAWTFTSFGWKLSKADSNSTIFPPVSCTALP